MSFEPEIAGHVENLLALGELVERDRDRRRGRAGHQDDLVLVDEGLLLLNRLIWFGGAVGRHELDRLAEHALVHFRRDRLHQRMVFIDVVDGELHALELVVARSGVRAGERHRGPDGDRIARRASRPSADRRLVIGIRPADPAEKTGQRRAGRARPKFQRAATRNCAGPLIPKYEFGHPYPPIDDLIPVSTRNLVFAALLLARKQPIRKRLRAG